MNSNNPNKRLDTLKYSNIDDFISLELCATTKEINMDLLSKLKPKFCSIPWLHHNTNQAIDNIPAILLAEKLCIKGYQVMSHLAGRNLNKQEALEILNKFKRIGVKNILALQGDEITNVNDTKRDFLRASDLVRFIRQEFGDYFIIGVAGYPDSENYETGIKYLQEKVDCGADMIITQSFFQYENLIEFHDRCRENSINVPIIPGLFIINKFERMNFMSEVCKVHIPEDIKKYILENSGDSKIIKSYGLNITKDLVNKIKNSGKFGGVHIFTFNDLDIIQEFYHTL